MYNTRTAQKWDDVFEPVVPMEFGAWEVAKSESARDVNVAKLALMRKYLCNEKAVWPFRWNVEVMMVDWRSHEPTYEVRVYAFWKQRGK